MTAQPRVKVGSASRELSTGELLSALMPNARAVLFLIAEALWVLEGGPCRWCCTHHALKDILDSDVTPCRHTQNDPAARPSMKDVVDRLLAVGQPTDAAKSPLNDSARSLSTAERLKPGSPRQLSPSVSEEEGSSAEEAAGGPLKQ